LPFAANYAIIRDTPTPTRPTHSHTLAINLTPPHFAWHHVTSVYCKSLPGVFSGYYDTFKHLNAPGENQRVLKLVNKIIAKIINSKKTLSKILKTKLHLFYLLMFPKYI